MQKPELALSVQQPWAWFIFHAGKDIENRVWPTRFRGRIYVHAGLRVRPMAAAEFHRLAPSLTLDEVSGLLMDFNKGYQCGAILGEVNIVDCVQQSDSPWFEGPYGFVLTDPVAYDRVIPCKGRLGFFKPALPHVEVPDAH